MNGSLSKRLWYGITAALAAWIVQGISGFVISDAACVTGGLTFATLRALLIVISIVALVVAISGGAIALRTWRTLSRQSELQYAEGRGRGEFMALSGIFISLIFSIAIIWGALAPMLVGPCAATR